MTKHFTGQHMSEYRQSYINLYTWQQKAVFHRRGRGFFLGKTTCDLRWKIWHFAWCAPSTCAYPVSIHSHSLIYHWRCIRPIPAIDSFVKWHKKDVKVISLYKFYRIPLLTYHWSQQLYHIESLHFSGYPATHTLFRDTIERTLCVFH